METFLLLWKGKKRKAKEENFVNKITDIYFLQKL